MRRFIPIEGDDYKKLIVVNLKRGDSVAEHQHEGHAVLYYPEGGDAVMVKPVAGMMIYLPPGTRHAVPTVSGDRVSVAMIVENPPGEGGQV